MKTFLHALQSFLERLRTGAHQDPVRDWLAMIVLSTTILAAIIVWNAWIFDTISNGSALGPAATTSPAVFNSSSLEVIHTTFADRAAEEAKYVTGVYRYTDPSQ